MPAKNAVKRYSENGYYHIYNRGAGKNDIFLNEQDYGVFLHYLKDYLSPPKLPTPEEVAAMKNPYLHKNYYGEIDLLSFCLMPNHFHLLVKQKKARSIVGFMRSLLIRYSCYFNKNHQRVGHLYQGIYKGVLVEIDEYLWWVSRYIHLNPLNLLAREQKLEDYSYSSYPVYLGKIKIDWVKPDLILANIKNYRDFVEGPDDKDHQAPEKMIDLIIETS